MEISAKRETLFIGEIHHPTPPAIGEMPFTPWADILNLCSYRRHSPHHRAAGLAHGAWIIPRTWMEAMKRAESQEERLARIGRMEIIDHQMAAVLRAKTPTERLHMSWGLWRFVRDMIRNSLRAENPNWDDERLQQEVARRMSHGAW